MIAALLSNHKGEDALLLVLEPANIEKLKSGQPITKYFSEFIQQITPATQLLIAYSPDVEWVGKQVREHGADLIDALRDSLGRPEIVARERSAEEMKRVF